MAGLMAWMLDDDAAGHGGVSPAATLLSAAVPSARGAGASRVTAESGAAAALTDPLLSGDLKQILEALLLQASGSSHPRDAAELKKRATELIPQYFPVDLRVRAAALLDRYIDYRVALGSVRSPADPGDPHTLRRALDERDALRRTWFAPEEDSALFAEENNLDRYTLARLDIERNRNLSPTEKSAALKQTESELSASQRAQRNDATSHWGVAAQTAAFEASGTSDQARYAQRQALYGDTAAAQLAQLDHEDRQWQSRLDEYHAALKSGAQPVDLQTLQARLFSDLERLRLDAALELRTQAGSAIR